MQSADLFFDEIGIIGLVLFPVALCCLYGAGLCWVRKLLRRVPRDLPRPHGPILALCALGCSIVSTFALFGLSENTACVFMLGGLAMLFLSWLSLALAAADVRNAARLAAREG